MSQQTVPPDLAVALKKWASKRGNLIMILHELQDHHGYVPRPLALEVARQLNVPLARIYEVLTFYNFFKLDPPGKYVISVCMGTACYLKGADEVLEAICQATGVESGQTSEDRMYHVQGVRCLGCCGLAPVVMVNGQIYSKVKPNDVPNIMADCQQQEQEA